MPIHLYGARLFVNDVEIKLIGESMLYLKYCVAGEWNKLGNAFEGIPEAIHHARKLSQTISFPANPDNWRVFKGDEEWKVVDWETGEFRYLNQGSGIKTYILQYHNANGDWVNLSDNDYHMIEFVDVMAARKIAEHMMKCPGYPATADRWLIKSSKGDTISIKWPQEEEKIDPFSSPKRWFRRKKVLISASQFFTGMEHKPEGVYCRTISHTQGAVEYYVTTAQKQDVVVKSGEWIVPENDGSDGAHCYPIAEQVFADTYESISETEARALYAKENPGDEKTTTLVEYAGHQAAKRKSDFKIKVGKPFQTLQELWASPAGKVRIGDESFTVEELIKAILKQEVEDERTP